MPARVGRKNWNYKPSCRERTAFHEAGHCVALFHVGFDLSTASIRSRGFCGGGVRVSRKQCSPAIKELRRTRRGEKQVLDLEIMVALSGMLGEHVRELWAGEELPKGITWSEYIEKHHGPGDWAYAVRKAAEKRDPPRNVLPFASDLDRLNRDVRRHLRPTQERIFIHPQYRAGLIAVAKGLLAHTTLSANQVRGRLKRAMARHGGPPPGHGTLRGLVGRARAQREGRRKGYPAT